MTGYPYDANFLRPLKAWPMLAACKDLKTISDRPEDAARALKTAMNAFYDPGTPACFNPNAKCKDAATDGLGDLYGWSWQSCTQIPIDICAQGPPDDVFWVSDRLFPNTIKILNLWVQNGKKIVCEIKFSLLTEYHKFLI